MKKGGTESLAILYLTLVYTVDHSLIKAHSSNKTYTLNRNRNVGDSDLELFLDEKGLPS